MSNLLWRLKCWFWYRYDGKFTNDFAWRVSGTIDAPYFRDKMKFSARDAVAGDLDYWENGE